MGVIERSNMIVLGIDIGGSATKGALVNTETGEVLSDKIRFASKKVLKPKQIIKAIKNIAAELQYEGIIGAGFPGIVKHGVIKTAANLHKDWVGTNLAEMIHAETGQKAFILNDADAAGMGEMRFGGDAIRSKDTALFLTIGTGIGSALFVKGQLLQNTELGHMLVNELEAEVYASASVKRVEQLTWKQWATRFNEVLKTYEFLLNPDIFILGGGVSARFEKYARYLTVETEVVPAKLENMAGIIGAAMAAQENLN